MMKIYSLQQKSYLKGFTLIELLIVIAILGILAAATLAVLDPIDKIRAGNDSKVQADIVTIAKAAEAYAAQNNGSYPSGTNVAQVATVLITSGDLRSTPLAPGGYSVYTWTGGGVGNFIVTGQLRSKKFVNAVPSTPVFKYSSATGKSCSATVVTGNCP